MGFDHMDAICTLQVALQMVLSPPASWRRRDCSYEAELLRIGSRCKFIETGILKDKKTSKYEDNIFVASNDFQNLMQKVHDGTISEILPEEDYKNQRNAQRGIKGGRPRNTIGINISSRRLHFFLSKALTRQTLRFMSFYRKTGGASGGPSRQQLQTNIRPLISAYRKSTAVGFRQFPRFPADTAQSLTDPKRVPTRSHAMPLAVPKPNESLLPATAVAPAMGCRT